MSKLVALIYADVSIPAEIYAVVRHLKEEGRIDLIDVTEVQIKDNGKLKFERAMCRPLVGHSEGIFLPALVGLLFFNPQQSVNDNVHKTMAEISLDPHFIKSISSEVSPGNSILFLYLRDNVSENILSLIARHGGRILQMTLAGFQEEKLEKLFHGHGLGDTQNTVIHAP